MLTENGTPARTISRAVSHEGKLAAQSVTTNSTPMVNNRESGATKLEVTTAVIFYCCCSGGMLIINKLAVHHLPLPALITVCQFSTASVVVFTAKLGGCLEVPAHSSASNAHPHPK